MNDTDAKADLSIFVIPARPRAAGYTIGIYYKTAKKTKLSRLNGSSRFSLSLLILSWMKEISVENTLFNPLISLDY